MENVSDPDTTCTATGWHYELMNFLRTVGYRPVDLYRGLLQQRMVELDRIAGELTTQQYNGRS
jgi:hypothetical protein